ncbi:MAG TPA: hypothetical protein ENL20_01365 [Candidatus Cloacimonetes bacterium]|nr:hypothetical protein [Candidatus Cloacimonadota bacterium]
MKITRKLCIFDFIFEVIFGAIFIILIILMKEPTSLIEGLPIGMGGGAIVYYFLRKRNLDERDYYLYYKVNHFTLGAVILGIVAAKLMNDIPAVSEFIQVNWSQMIILVFFLFHGLFGLILFLKK